MQINARKHAIFLIFVLLQATTSVQADVNTEDKLAGNLVEKSILENQKLTQEIYKLKLENDKNEKPSGLFDNLLSASFISALTALISIPMAVWKQYSEIAERRKSEYKQREAELKQEQLDKERRLEERLTAVFENLNSDKVTVQASAAASLLAIIQPHNKAYLDTILCVLIVNLKEDLKKSPVVLDILTRALEKVFQLMLDGSSSATGSQSYAGKRSASVSAKPLLEFNLSRTFLVRPNFEALDFKGAIVDVAFADLTLANLKDAKHLKLRGIEVTLEKAKLSRASLNEARLNKAKCQGAQFHETVLTSATFKEADLRDAEFMRAKLQSAHFEGADLRGAKFEDANISDAYFDKAIFDAATKQSLIKAQHWRNAHFEQSIQQELELLESKKHRASQMA